MAGSSAYAPVTIRYSVVTSVSLSAVNHVTSLYTVQGGDADPLPNTATITCAVEGFDNTASDSDDHSVDLIAPAIEVTKTGPAVAKVGDEITYTIGFTALSDGDLLGECTGNDPLLGGDLGVFVSGQPRDFTVHGTGWRRRIRC